MILGRDVGGEAGVVQGLLKSPGLLKESCPAPHPHGGTGINCLYLQFVIFGTNEVIRLLDFLHSLCLLGELQTLLSRDFQYALLGPA